MKSTQWLKKYRPKSLILWLEKHHELSYWVQAIGVVIAMAFGVMQLKLGREALQFNAKSNEIMLKASASDLLFGINSAALSNPEAAGAFPGHMRLHLMRLHYFFRTYQIRKEGFMDDDGFEAESNYLKWAGKLPDFYDVWGEFRLTYRSDFRAWVDTTINYVPKEIPKPEVPQLIDNNIKNSE